MFMFYILFALAVIGFPGFAAIYAFLVAKRKDWGVLFSILFLYKLLLLNY